MGNLKEIRQAVRHKRQAITGERRTELSQQTSEVLLDWLEQQSNIEHIATFLSLTEEIDTTFLNAALWERGYHLYLPFVAEKNQPLKWLSYSPSTQLCPDKANILAPESSSKPAPKLDLVITPLVAFDSSGTRLGMGGGFYDRSFQGRIAPKSPLLVGFAYPCQQVSTLPRRSWDIPLNACAVADQFFIFLTPLGEPNNEYN